MPQKILEDLKLKEAGRTPRFHGNGFTQLYLNKTTRLHFWHPALKPIRNHNATIHNHRYDVRSTVYSGRLRHRTWDVICFNDPKTWHLHQPSTRPLNQMEMEAYMASLVEGVAADMGGVTEEDLQRIAMHVERSTTLDDEMEEDVQVMRLDAASDHSKAGPGSVEYTGKLVLRHDYELAPGSTYTHTYPHLHSSDAVGVEPIVTIFEQHGKDDSRMAQVVTDIGQELPTHAFDPATQPDVDLMWELMEDALWHAQEATGRAAIARIREELEPPTSGG